MKTQERLPELTPYTFGTMSLGRDTANFAHDVSVARQAMEKGLWFHSSRSYGTQGGTFNVLRQAFADAPGQVPQTIFKIGCENADLIENDVAFTLQTLGLPKMEVAQLAGKTHEKRDIVEDFLAKGPMYQVCQKLKESGVVEHFVFEIFYSYAADALKAVVNDLFDGYIFYYSLLERQVSNEIEAVLEQKKLPILSLRPNAGGFLSNSDNMRQRRLKTPDHPAFLRLDELAPLFEKSGCRDFLEFSLRFLASHSLVKTTIAGTADHAHLHSLAESVSSALPLDKNLVEEVRQLQSKWCREGLKYQFSKELW